MAINLLAGYKNLGNLSTSRNYLIPELRAKLESTSPTAPLPESMVTGVPFEQQLYIPAEAAGIHITSQPLPSTYAGGIFSGQDITLKTLPTRLGGGQYLQKGTTPTLEPYELYTRGSLTSGQQKLLRGGLSTALTEQDHIVPLWAGGADVNSNREILTVPEHRKKTAIQNIIRTLYETDKISQGEAVTQSLNWRDKDITPFLDKNGNLPLGDDNLVPQDVMTKVTKYWEEPPKIGIGDLWSALWGKKGETPELLRESLKETILEKPMGPVSEFAQSTASAFTGGWLMPVSQAKYETPLKQTVADVARITGQIFGTFAAFATGERLVGAAAARLGIKPLATIFPTLKKPIVGFIKPSINVGTLGTIESTAKTWNDVVKGAGLFSAGSILSKHEEATFSDRVKGLMLDATQGALMGAAGQRLADYATVFPGTFVVSYLETGDPKESLNSAIIMTGFHGLGRIGYNKEAANNIIKKNAENISLDLIKNDLQLVKKSTTLENIKITSEIKKERLEKKAYQVIDSRVDDGIYTKKQADIKKSQAVTALNYLHTGGLEAETQLAKGINDVLSLGKLLKREKIMVEKPVPELIRNYVNKNIYKEGEVPTIEGLPGGATIKELSKSEIKKLSQGTPLGVSTGITPSSTGFYPVSGTSKYTNEYTSRNIQLIDKDRKNGLPTTGIVVESKSKISSDGKDLELWGVSPNRTVFLGYVPDAKKIPEFNKKFNKEFFSSNNNREKLWDDMQKAGELRGGVRILPVELNFVSIATKTGGQTSVGFNLTPSHWRSAINIEKEYKRMEPQLVQDTINEQMNTIKESGSGLNESMSDLPIDNLNEDGTFRRLNLNNFLDMVSEELRVGTPESLRRSVNERLGFESMTEQQARDAFDNKELFSLKDAIKPIVQPDINGKAATSIEALKLQKDLKALYATDKDWRDWYLGFKDKPFLPESVALERVGEIKEELKPFEVPEKETVTTTKGVELIKENLPGGQYWLEQNKTKTSDFAKLAKEGNDVKWLMDENGYVGPVSINGEVYQNKDLARKDMVKGVIRKEQITRREIEQAVEKPTEIIDMQNVVDDTTKPDKMSSNEEQLELNNTDLFDPINVTKRDSVAAWGEYDVNGILKGISSIVSVEGEDAIRFNRKSLTAKAKEIVIKNNGDKEKSFNEFKKEISDYITTKTAEENPLNNELKNKTLKHHFLRLASEQPKYKINFGISSSKIEKSEPSVESKGDFLVSDYKKSNSLPEESLQIISVDADNSLGLRQKGLRELNKYNYIRNGLEKKDYLVLGTKANSLDKILAVKIDKSLIDKFNANPDNYEFNLDKSDWKTGLTDPEKFKRVFMLDVLKLPKSTTSSINKRWNLIFNNELQNQAPKRDYSHLILKSPSVKELEEYYGTDIYDRSRISTDLLDSKELTGKLNRPAFDGIIFGVNKGTMKEWTDYNALPMKMSEHWKPTTFYNYIDEAGNNAIFLQKGSITPLGSYREFLKDFYKLTDEDINRYEIITFTDNVKEGLESIPVKNINGVNIQEINIPSDEYRFKYSKSETADAKFSPSYIAKFQSADGVNNYVKELYNRGWSKYKELKDRIMAGDDLTKLSKEYKDLGFNIEGIYGPNKELLKYGAGKNKLSKQISEQLNKIWQIYVMRLSHVPSRYLFAIPDPGRMVNGKRVFLKPGETVMNDQDIKALNSNESLELRNPSTKMTALSKNKIYSASEYGIELPKGQVIISYHDGFLNKEFDFDGDTLADFKIGGSDGVPRQIINVVENKRSKIGDRMLPELTKYTKQSPTIAATDEMLNTQTKGIIGVNSGSTTNRVFTTLIDNNVTVKYGGVEIGFKWDRPEQDLVTRILQESVDSLDTINLGKIKDFDGNYLLKKLVKPISGKQEDINKLFKNGELIDERALTAVREAIGGKFMEEYGKLGKRVRKFGNYQEIFTLANKDREIDSNEFLHNRINRINDLARQSKGTLSPIQEITLLMDKEQPFIMLDYKMVKSPDGKGQIALSSICDWAGSDTVITTLKGEIGPSLNLPKVEEFKNVVKAARLRYLAARPYSVERKAARQSVIDFYNNNKGSYDQKIKDAIAYWTATEKTANFAHTPGYDYPKFAYRFEDVIAGSPKVATEYLKGYEGFDVSPYLIKK